MRRNLRCPRCGGKKLWPIRRGKARQMLAEGGFSHVDVTQHEGDLFNNYFIITKE